MKQFIIHEVEKIYGEGEKMSKSIGNIRLVHDLKSQYRGEVLRLTLLSAHYRQPLNWSDSTITEANNLLKKFIILNILHIQLNLRCIIAIKL